MEQKMEQGAVAGGVMTPEVPKKNTGLIVGMIACAVLAVGGVSFGIYEMSQVNQAKDQIADLKVEVKKDDGTTTTIETPEIKTTTEDGTTITIADTPTKISGGPYITDGYFYVPDWGWKFKIPDGLVGVGFSVDYDEAHVGYDLPFIGFTAYPESHLVASPQDQYYDDILSCSIIEVNKSKKGANQYSLSGDDREVDGNILRISNYSSSFCDFTSNSIKAEVYNELRTMFQNPENI
ncbi:hypothetical protein IJI17_00600 [Candidatus Saccharibacteria bacterium]|nr:hypothetical protein [Candidatus Saccharibacteria bacterium]